MIKSLSPSMPSLTTNRQGNMEMGKAIYKKRQEDESNGHKSTCE